MELDCKLVEDKYRPELTGYFRDGERRVDLVLVLSHLGNENIGQIQSQFLMSAVNVGLELEVEFAVMKRHEHLMFVKVHAPVELIEEYGKLYSEHKPFKRNHLQLFEPNPGLLGWLLPPWREWYEREWVDLIRLQYPAPQGYSTLERSRIVHRLMQLVRFGEAEDEIGLHKLQAAAVVEDVYPLHDGPYFHIRRQLKVCHTGRQILFLDWVGYHNLLTPQPLHVIREYLGERIAFLFACFELVNCMMIPIALLSILVFLVGHVSDPTDEIINTAACKKEPYTYLKWVASTTYWYYTYSEHHVQREYWWRHSWTRQYPFLWNRTISTPLKHYMTLSATYNCWHWWSGWFTSWDYLFHYNKTFEDRRLCFLWSYIKHEYTDMPVCPQCDDLVLCPFRNLTQYCDEVKTKTMLDNPYAIPFSFVVSLWGVLVYLLWKRREAYLYWIWEVNKSDTDSVMRPEHATSRLAATRGPASEFVAAKIKALGITAFKTLLVFCIHGLYCFGFIAVLMTATNAALKLHFREFESELGFRYINYALYVLMATINALVTILIEKTGRRLAYALVDMTNPRTPAAYEKELVLRMFTFTLTFNFSYLFHLAFVKGQLYKHPGSLTAGREHCGLLSCIDEVCITIIVSIIARHLFLGFASHFRSRLTDYNRKEILNVPCWEREYLLCPLTDHHIMNKIETLMIQLALATFFVSMVPLAPLAILFINMWMIRRWAEEMLLRSRRPLLRIAWGLGFWNNVLELLPFLAAACNALATTLNSNIFDVNLHTRYFPERRFFADITMSFYNLSTGFPYGNRTLHRHIYFPHFCLFPGKWNRIIHFREVNVFDRVLELFVPTVLKIYINANQAEFFILFMVMVVLSALILYRLVEQKPRDVAEAEEQQRAVLHSMLVAPRPRMRIPPSQPRPKQD